MDGQEDMQWIVDSYLNNILLYLEVQIQLIRAIVIYLIVKLIQ